MPASFAHVRACGFLLLLAGCAGPAPQVQRTSAPVPVAPMTAASGWVGGVAARDGQRRAALAAGVPALTADAVPYYVDVEEARLREQLAGTGVDVVRLGDELRLRLPGGTLFQPDRADLAAPAHALLDAVAAVLQKFDKSLVEVAGYADSSGAADHNQALSERRAEAVSEYLRGRGVRRARVATIGAGEARPVGSNATADGRARNRRIELTLSPLVK
ncbi:MAG: OmpA family protein [Deltaproteobacteria bacterium]